jgi:hypothetical protein
MAYREEKTIWDQVNSRGSKLWIQMNDSSKARKHREQFIQTHGGFFKQDGRYWVWVNPVKEHNGYWLKRVDTGEKTFFENMNEFATSQGMTSVKICELLNGKRKTYKGWTAVEIRDVKETTGSHEKQKEPKKKKIIPVKTVVFQDKVTNEVFTVTNLRQFSINNGFDYNNIKSLANGRLKSVKNLKLFNPLEKYKDSPEPK